MNVEEGGGELISPSHLGVQHYIHHTTHDQPAHGEQSEGTVGHGEVVI